MTKITNDVNLNLQEVDNNLMGNNIVEQEETKVDEKEENKVYSSDKSKESLSLLDYQAILAKAGQGVVYSTTEGTALPAPLQLIVDTKDPLSCLSSIWIYGLDELDESQLQVTKRSDGQITDIMYNGVRYGIRYDANGNIIKTIMQSFDDAGNVANQTVSNWENGDIENTIFYEYQYDESGTQVGQTRKAVDKKYGLEMNVLNEIFNAGIICPCELFDKDLQTQRTQDGKITEIIYDGVRYALRYDANGNLTKAFTQEFDESGNVTKQNITEYNNDGSVKNVQNYAYEFLDNAFVEGATGVDRITTQTDENGNVVQKIVQDLDENGNVTAQNVINYNEDGSEMNRIYYTYSVNESGAQVQNRVAIDSKYNPLQLLAIYGIEYTGDIGAIDGIPNVGSYFGDLYLDITNIKRNQDGQILEFIYQGRKFNFNYDTNGNVI